MVVSCTVFEIKRDIGRKTPVFHTHLPFNLHDHLETLLIFSQNFNTYYPSSLAIKRCKNIADRVQKRYRKTTDGLTQYRPNVRLVEDDARSIVLLKLTTDGHEASRGLCADRDFFIFLYFHTDNIYHNFFIVNTLKTSELASYRHTRYSYTCVYI